MSVIERAPKAAVIGLALGLIGAPALAKDLKPEPTASPEASASQETISTYKVPLDVMRDMMDVTSPAIEEVFNAVSQNPQGHIEIIDGFGYGDNPFNPDGFSYYLFPDEQIKNEVDPQWSVAVFVDSVNSSYGGATIILQMNGGLRVYGGREDSLSGNPISEEILVRVSDEIFNEPDFLREKPWEFIPDTTVPMFGKFHIDENGKYFDQVVTADNQIIFSSPFPFPENLAGNPQEITMPEDVS